MATKGLFGFKKHKVNKVTYSHRDSYPAGLGQKVVDFCRRHTVDELNKMYDEIVMVDEEATMSPELVQAYKKYLPDEMWNQNLDWPTVMKYTEDITNPLSGGIRQMVDYDSFSGSYRCRWIHIINLNAGYLEIFKNGSEMIGIKIDSTLPIDIPSFLQRVLVAKFPLDNIPDNWLEIATKNSN